MQINKYKNLGQGWNGESQRHSNAKKYGIAGGLYAESESWRGDYSNISKGFALEGTTYDKGSPIWFLFKNKRDLNLFNKNYNAIVDNSNENYEIDMEDLYRDFEDKMVVVDSYQGGGDYENFKEGRLFNYYINKDGRVSKSGYMKIPNNNIIRMKGYVY